MKKFGILAGVLVLLMTGYIFKAPIVSYAENILYHSPCDTPRTYRIGSIDPKYNLTHDQFLERVNQSEEIWETEIGKDLFLYVPEGDIEINLVYDQRSLLSRQINDLNSKVKEQQSALDPKIADYKRRASEFRSKIDQLNNDIEFWNNKGGAPPDEYEKLKSRQASLQQEADSLRSEAETLNQSTDEFNAQVGQLHQTVSTFNTALQYKPEEGEYIYDNGQETINIYFDNSQTELVHTLAHELGHALGIPHNNDPLSIMYPQTSEAVALTDNDRAGLEKACEEKSVVQTGAQKLALVINSLRVNFAR